MMLCCISISNPIEFRIVIALARSLHAVITVTFDDDSDFRGYNEIMNIGKASGFTYYRRTVHRLLVKFPANILLEGRPVTQSHAPYTRGYERL
jgi:hypothetical protein